MEQISKIYKGELKNWKEVDKPVRQIFVIDKEKSKGTRHVFIKYFFGDEEAEAPGAQVVLGSKNKEQTALSESDSAIGMLSNAWVKAEVKGIGPV